MTDSLLRIPDGVDLGRGASFSGTVDQNGRADGSGRVSFEDSLDIQWIEGTFDGGRTVGPVEIRFVDSMYSGGTYTGEVDEGFAPRGEGSYVSGYGNRYVGTFRCRSSDFWSDRRYVIYQRLTFDGSLEIPNLDYVARGSFKRGQPHGNTIIKWDGKTFKGVFEAGVDERVDGKVTFDDGRVYSGPLQANNTYIHPLIGRGRGFMRYPDGRVVSGSFDEDGTRHPSPPVHAKQHWIVHALPLTAMAVLGGLAATGIASSGGVSEMTYILLAGMALCLMYILVRAALARFNVLSVAGDRIVHQTGIFAQRRREVPLGTALAVDLRRGLLGRLFGYGTVAVRHEGELVVEAPHIRNPVAFFEAAKGDGLH